MISGRKTNYQLHLRRSGSGKQLIMIHGLAVSGLIWDQMLPYLQDDYELIRIDLLGYGQSPKPRIDYTPQAHVEAIRYTLRQQNIQPPYNLVGLSMGSIIALTCASLYPSEVSRIISFGLPYYQSSQQARFDLRTNFWTRLVLEKPLLARLVIGVVWRIAPHSQYLLQKCTPAIYTQPQKIDSTSARYRSFSSSLLQCMVNYRIEPLFKKLPPVPALFIHGQEDAWSPVERVRALLAGKPDCRFETIPGCGHNVAILAPESAADYIKQFIDNKL